MKVLTNTAHFSPAVARWRPRGGRVAAAAAALASLALTVTAHSLLISTFFCSKGYLTRSAMSGWGKNERTNEQTDRLKVYELVPLPKVGLGIQDMPSTSC